VHNNEAFEGGLLGADGELKCIREALSCAQAAQQLAAQTMANAGDGRLLTAASVNDVKVCAFTLRCVIDIGI
jgi:hypothetical protein